MLKPSIATRRLRALGFGARPSPRSTSSPRAGPNDEQPPLGRLLDVDGNRVHVVERGAGPPVVLIHGNGSLAQGWPAPGVVDRLAAHHLVLIAERPGFGYTVCPRERIWTPSAQARLIRGALDRPGVGPAAIFGHSWGTLVTLAHAHAVDHPEQTRSIMLLSAY